MKINVEVDCTPEEARRFMGLPDLTPVHDAYIAQILDTVKNGVSSETMEAMLKGWAPMGDAGMNLWKDLFEKVTKSGKN
ncbi:DUF6489 family protein [soil metagenome]